MQSTPMSWPNCTAFLSFEGFPNLDDKKIEQYSPHMDFDLILNMQEEEYRVPTEFHQMKKAAKPRGLT